MKAVMAFTGQAGALLWFPVTHPIEPSVPARQPFFNWKFFTKKEKSKIKIMKVKWLLGIFYKPELKNE
jgi:hypothetical protein